MQPHAESADESGKHCIGTSLRGLTCDAISAQAAFEQTTIARDQARLSGRQTMLGFLTLIAAIAAAIFAERAAHHTKRGANISRQAFVNSTRAWMDFEVAIDPSEPLQWWGGACRIGLAITQRHVGNVAATDVALDVYSTSRSDDRIPIEKFIKKSRGIPPFLAEAYFPGAAAKPTKRFINIDDSENPNKAHNQLSPTVVVIVSYGLPWETNEARHVTVRAYYLRQNHCAIKESQCPIPADQVTLGRHTFYSCYMD